MSKYAEAVVRLQQVREMLRDRIAAASPPAEIGSEEWERWRKIRERREYLIHECRTFEIVVNTELVIPPRVYELLKEAEQLA